MCSKFQLQKPTMENNYQGDLADIFLGSSGPNISGANNITNTSGESSSTTAAAAVTDGWLGQFPSHPINYSASAIEDSSDQDFGDPFCNLRDPLFNDLDMMSASSNLFISNNDNNNNNNNNISLFGPKILEETEMKSRPTGNIFSRMLQISPTTKLAAAMSPCNSLMTGAVALQPPSTVIVGGGELVANDAIISPNSSKTCLVENSGLQISSPRNTGIKRRKSQAKKVVCIPAPAPANSRQGGEIVPSDQWAWRKYGQKPIKGSPYPRGYYRCSSSKGCSARKQVERSRTDPNMLVITYTSEHNHPWPTQRNALAGSTRSQPNNFKHTTTSTSKNNINSKDDEQNTSTTVAQINISKVKEEVAELQDLRHDHDQQQQQLAVEMHDVEFCKDSYQPILPDSSSNNSHEDFFADLVELEADPLNLLFAKTLSEDINEAGQKKTIDAFDMYDWSGNNNNKSQADP